MRDPRDVRDTRDVRERDLSDRYSMSMAPPAFPPAASLAPPTGSALIPSSHQPYQPQALPAGSPSSLVGRDHQGRRHRSGCIYAGTRDWHTSQFQHLAILHNCKSHFHHEYELSWQECWSLPLQAKN
ncbi:hypothetical protein AX17_003222 [Amanita inopinata Kibby_2008]|nr:hypothetical protein AX17_003222 [Amanita inopinata Kibby_2008]